MAQHNEFGKWGEDLACEKLISEGYAIVARNWRMAHAELDIVAMRDDTIVFAEVKTRNPGSGDPFDAINRKKIAHMAAAADTFIRAGNFKHTPRFDIFGIVGTPEDYKIEHIADAFLPPLKKY